MTSIYEHYDSERGDLSDMISDCYKDINGTRPRHIDFINTPIEELRKIAENLYSYHKSIMEHEEREKEKELHKVMELASCDIETAKRWLDEAQKYRYY